MADSPHKLLDHFGGWVAQQPDHRDKHFQLEERILTPAQLPAKVDLWPHVPSIWDQLQEGSCTAHGALRALIIEMSKQGLSYPSAAPGTAPFSRQGQYWWSRDLEGTTQTDSGASCRDAVKVLASIGAAPETMWPYSQPLTLEPTQDVHDAAGENLALKYQAITVGGPGAPIRTALANGLGVIYGFSVPSSFEDGSWDPAATPLMLPGPNQGFLGGHCNVLTGYDWTRTLHPRPYFISDNSWNEGWGGSWGGAGCSGGRFALDYEWFDPWRGLASDLWVVQFVK